jgi:type I restriction enzyme S subunit
MENNLPIRWQEISLEEIASYVIGGDWGKESREAGHEKIFVLRGTDYKNWDKVRAKNSAIRYFKKQSIEKRQLTEGDIILEVSGGGPDQPVGRVVSIDRKALESVDGKLSFSNFFRLIRINKNINPYFVKAYLDYAYSRGDFNDMQTHTTNLRNLRVNEFLSKTMVPIPPLSEQQRLVAKLDELMEKIDRSCARLERIPKILKRFRQSVLNAAVSGKLTEKWRKENSCNPDEQLRKIKAKRQQLFKEEKKWSRSKTQALNSEYLNVIEEIPDSWRWVKWEDVGLTQNGKSFPSSNYRVDGFKLLRPGNLHVNGNLTWTKENTKCLPIEFAKVHNEHLVGPNEIVMNLTAQSLKDEFLGRVCMSTSGDECLLNQRLARIAPVDFSTQYCFLVLKSPLFRKFVDQLNTGTLIQHMFSSQLDQFQFPFPTIEEQEEIARRVEKHFALADKIEEHYQKAQAHLNRIPQSLLAKAFRGELVHQDEDDEPGTELLEKIRSTKAVVSNKNGKASGYNIEPVTDFNIAAESNGLYKGCQPINIPENKKAFAKQVLGGKIVSLFKDDPHFTHIKFQKLQYLAEHLAEVDLYWNYYRQSAGPYDPKFMHTVALKLKVSKWFEEKKYKFHPLEKADKIEGYYEGYFKPVATKLDSLFSSLKESTEDEAEIVATLYAVWNNMIIKKDRVNDDLIVSTFFEWSDRKKKYSQPEVSSALVWMRKSGFVPTGFGKVIKEKRK